MDKSNAEGGRNKWNGSKKPENFFKTTKAKFYVFWTSFSASLSSDVPPLKIKLTLETRRARIKLQNYSTDQWEFLTHMVASLQKCGLIYPNPSAILASTPPLDSKTGPARFLFTADIRIECLYSQIRLLYSQHRTEVATGRKVTLPHSTFPIDIGSSHLMWKVRNSNPS